jgi:hypothetical protein
MPGYQVPLTTVDANTTINNQKLVTTGLNVGKNFIINGNFDFWQRGTSFTNFTAYNADRWFHIYTENISRQSFSSVPEVSGSTYFLRWIANQASYHAIQQKIENGGVLLSGQNVTISFWAKSNTSNSFNLYVHSNLENDQQEIGTNFTISSTWTKYSATLAIPVTNGASVTRYVRFTLPYNSTTYGIDLAQVQLEIGSNSTPFTLSGGTISGELINCQRYYEKSYRPDTALQTNTTIGINQTTDAYYSTNTTQGTRVNYRVEKRAIPTVATYRRDGSATNPNYWAYYTNATANYAAFSVDGGSSSTNGFIGWFNGTATAITSGWANAVVGHWTADAEL